MIQGAAGDDREGSSPPLKKVWEMKFPYLEKMIKYFAIGASLF
jgi:hypothetical protein